MWFISLICIAIAWWLVGWLVKTNPWRTLTRLAISHLVLIMSLTLLQAAPQEDSSLLGVDEEGNLLAPLEVALVQRGNLPVVISATGVVAPVREANLTFEARTSVQSVYVQMGQHVQEGQVLAALDTAQAQADLFSAQVTVQEAQRVYDTLRAPARAVDVAVAQASVTAAQSSVGAASQTTTTNQLEIARLETELARNNLWLQQLTRDLNFPSNRRPIVDPDTGAVTGYDYAGPPITYENDPSYIQNNTGLRSAELEVTIADASYQEVLNRDPDSGRVASAQARVTQAQAELDRLLIGPTPERLRRAELDLESAQLGLAQAQERLQQHYLVAPFDGVVALINLNPGQLPPTERAMILINTQSFRIELAVDENEVANVTLGQAVQIEVNSFPSQPVTGHVTRIASIPTTIGQRVTYNVRVQIDPSTAPLRPGLQATGNIILRQLEEVILVPNGFIQIDPETAQPAVIVESLTAGYVRVPIVLGQRGRTHSEVLEGLESGMQVILLPSSPQATSILGL